MEYDGSIMQEKIAFNIARHILLTTSVNDPNAASNIAIADSMLRRIGHEGPVV